MTNPGSHIAFQGVLEIGASDPGSTARELRVSGHDIADKLCEWIGVKPCEGFDYTAPGTYKLVVVRLT